MTQEDPNQPVASKSKGKLIVMALVALLLVGAGAGAAFFLLMDSSTVQHKIAEEEKAQVKLETLYVVLPQPFIFNVTGDQRQRMVQVNVQLMVKGNKNEALAKQNLPMIESSLLTTFGAATVEQLRSKDGLIDLRKQALMNVQSAMEKIKKRQ